ncbi:MAG TPA: sulfotransferase [Sandaracinaceae bacterium]
MHLRPDFLVIGAMKCATSTLHEQLACQPGIFMTTPKEPCFFSDDDVYARGIAWYEGLFAAGAQAALRGESSTHYTKLPTYPRTIERIRAHRIEPKLVYVMRDPIDRLVSHYVHEWTEARIDEPIDVAIDRHPELVDYGCYAMQLRPYFEAFGAERVLPVSLHRLEAAPQAELTRICRFLGYRGEPRWNPAFARRNVTAERLRKSPIRDALVEQPLLAVFRRLLPKQVRERAKDLWRMKERPLLPPEQRARLAERFDADLAELGRWLGLELSCRNFASVTAERPLAWTAATTSAFPPPGSDDAPLRAAAR